MHAHTHTVLYEPGRTGGASHPSLCEALPKDVHQRDRGGHPAQPADGDGRLPGPLQQPRPHVVQHAAGSPTLRLPPLLPPLHAGEALVVSGTRPGREGWLPG